MKLILLILTAFCTQCATAQISLLPAFQWRIDTSSGSDRYVWPDVCDEFLQNAHLEEIKNRLWLQARFGGEQEISNRRIVVSLLGPPIARMHSVLTEAQWRNLFDRMTKQARRNPWVVLDLIHTIRRIGPMSSAGPLCDEHMTFALYEGLIDLPGVTIFEYSESRLCELVSRTTRSDLWLARIQADIEAEEKANGETDRSQFLRMLKYEFAEDC